MKTIQHSQQHHQQRSQSKSLLQSNVIKLSKRPAVKRDRILVRVNHALGKDVSEDADVASVQKYFKAYCFLQRSWFSNVAPTVQNCCSVSGIIRWTLTSDSLLFLFSSIAENMQCERSTTTEEKKASRMRRHLYLFSSIASLIHNGCCAHEQNNCDN